MGGTIEEYGQSFIAFLVLLAVDLGNHFNIIETQACSGRVQMSDGIMEAATFTDNRKHVGFCNSWQAAFDESLAHGKVDSWEGIADGAVVVEEVVIEVVHDTGTR